MLPVKKCERKKKSVLLLEVYAKYKREFLNRGVNKQEIWKKIAHEMKKKGCLSYDASEWYHKVAELRRDYEKIKHAPATNGEMVDFKVAAKNAFETIENPVTVTASKLKMATWARKQMKKDRLFETNIALLTVYRLHKDEFTIHVNVANEWKKIAEKLNEKFPSYNCRPAQCRDKVLFMKKQYEKQKDKNVISAKDAIFLKEAKLAFETKEHPVTFMDEHKKEKLLSTMKAFNMHKAQFLSPDANQEELWQKIIETEHKLSLRDKPYSVPDFRNRLRYQKSKYDNLKYSNTDITTPEDAVFFEAAKLAFESTGSEAILDQILHDRVSEKSKQRFERNLALLRAYNIYKGEFSSPKEEDESVWEKIAGTVRISCSFNRWTKNDCRLQLFQMKEKYEKKKRDWYLISQVEADILLEEEKLAFETISYPDEHEQMDFLTEIGTDSVTC